MATGIVSCIGIVYPVGPWSSFGMLRDPRWCTLCFFESFAFGSNSRAIACPGVRSLSLLTVFLALSVLPCSFRFTCRVSAGLVESSRVFWLLAFLRFVISGRLFVGCAGRRLGHYCVSGDGIGTHLGRQWMLESGKMG